MSEVQAPYIIRADFPGWEFEQDIEADEAAEYLGCTGAKRGHRHTWKLRIDILPAPSGEMENEVRAWCPCGAELDESQIEMILNEARP